ncbi:hypothetical protein BURPS1106B_A2020 [Burkholderia pseudomallei 1106b]|uniref:Uncharacterized protein n=1 Tax=Burkholderia pseudomallei (strain 1106a) TaxID=357348 RepID=A3NXH8_BURP0|nr:hypothetical protein BURPS1106A_2798 [Burkholderia pseudomallei 1106a]AFR16695.1 hypothetical protein BPC006_I2837 [Burkholderia pseudomallei BPC006]EDO94621.1 hypothetical protein BURPSPAST_R0075 [Burkholderia pseudomallei Pasteur 52237]EES26234.1 hypothetical protein BURPS1106B_A2020 [Burkholderia pseudomallei 1106b]
MGTERGPAHTVRPIDDACTQQTASIVPKRSGSRRRPDGYP